MYKFNFAKHTLLASAALFAALPALAAEGSNSSVAVAAAPHASVNCPGITSVPMTADAEQALPLQHCGDARLRPTSFHSFRQRGLHDARTDR